jgi:hypothetical protein
LGKAHVSMKILLKVSLWQMVCGDIFLLYRNHHNWHFLVDREVNQRRTIYRYQISAC